MDILICATLSLVQTWLSGSLEPSDGWSHKTVAFVFFVAQYTALKIYRICVYHRYFSPLRHVPGPKDGHFLLGQALNLLMAPTPTTLHVRWMRQFPDAPFIRYLSFFNTEVLVCNSVEACRAMLQTHVYSVRKSDWFIRSGRDITGTGLLALEGAEHRAHRRVLGAPFSSRSVRRLEPLFKEKARGASAALQQAIDGGDDAGKTGVIDCSEVFTKAFLDIIGMATLGKELSQLATVDLGGVSTRHGPHDGPGAGESPFHRAYAEFFAPPDKWKQLLTFASGFLPVRWLPLQANHDFKFAMRSLHEAINSLVRERFAEARTAAPEKPNADASNDLLTFIIEESLPGGSAEGIPEDVLISDLLSFMAAGHETSATAVSWCLLVMAENPHIQHKLRTQVTELAPRDGDISYAEIEKLWYLENFIKEVLRVYPPANALFRQTSRDMTVEGVFIAKDTLVDMCCAMLQLNPLIWGDDADVVNPDRWDDIPMNDKRLDPFAFEAFSNGPRICLGKSFAMLELKTVLVELVRHFNFLKVEGDFTFANPSLVLKPNGLRIRLERI